MSVRVVIAEDEAIVRLDLKEILEEQGYEVVGETGRGDEVVGLVDRLEPDLVILDIKMPGADGLSIAPEISRGRRSAVLILTAFSQRELVAEARDAGVLGFLVKPFQRAELLPAIEVALGRLEEMRALDAEMDALKDANRSLGDKLEARRTIDRAKGVLMDRHGMKEADAFRFIQRTAMRTRLTMVEVSSQVLDGSVVP